MTDLKPCRVCGADARVEAISNDHFQGNIWICSNSARMDGTCEADVHLTEESWQARPETLRQITITANVLDFAMLAARLSIITEVVDKCLDEMEQITDLPLRELIDQIRVNEKFERVGAPPTGISRGT